MVAGTAAKTTSSRRVGVSIAEQIGALSALAAMDAEVTSLEEQLTEERAVLRALTDRVERLDARLAGDRAALVTAEKQRSESHIELRSSTQQVEHSREKLNRSRNERESNAAQREIEELRKVMRDKEEELSRFDLSISGLRGSIEAVESERTQVSDELRSKESAIQAKVAKLEVDKSAAGGGRDALVKRLPPVLYRRYEQIRAKRGTALAQTLDGTCNKCNIALPPQLYHRLRREPLLEQCPSCNRMIYFAPSSSPKPE